MADGDIHTTYDSATGTWKNKAEGSSRSFGAADTKAEAQAAGREAAIKREAEHFVHKRDGTFGERNTYPRSRDPKRSKG